MKINIIGLVLGVFVFLGGCQHTASTDASQSKKGLVKVTILYPNGDGKTFDMDYYASKHMPMVATLLGESMKFFAIDEGISGRTPDEPIPYLAIGYLYFDKLSDYQDSFAPHAEKIVGDIPNYTNIQPVVQISKVLQ